MHFKARVVATAKMHPLAARSDSKTGISKTIRKHTVIATYQQQPQAKESCWVSHECEAGRPAARPEKAWDPFMHFGSFTHRPRYHTAQHYRDAQVLGTSNVRLRLGPFADANADTSNGLQLIGSGPRV
jgi:hypothetical protein